MKLNIALDMEGQKFFNKKQLYFQFKLIDFFKNKFFGVKFFKIGRFEERLEVLNNQYLLDYKNNKWIILTNLLYSIVPKNRSMQKKKLVNIYFLDFINSYRGYRHVFGLPTRGQRTWTNGNSVFKSNTTLRNYKLSIFKKTLPAALRDNVNNAYYLEQINFLWKNQWELEWNLAYRHHAVALKKNRGFVKYDVNTLSRVNPNIRDFKKQKLFSIGFESGFTKDLLKNQSKLKNK